MVASGLSEEDQLPLRTWQPSSLPRSVGGGGAGTSVSPCLQLLHFVIQKPRMGTAAVKASETVAEGGRTSGALPGSAGEGGTVPPTAGRGRGTAVHPASLVWAGHVAGAQATALLQALRPAARRFVPPTPARQLYAVWHFRESWVQPLVLSRKQVPWRISANTFPLLSVFVESS